MWELIILISYILLYIYIYSKINSYTFICHIKCHLHLHNNLTDDLHNIWFWTFKDLALHIPTPHFLLRDYGLYWDLQVLQAFNLIITRSGPGTQTQSKGIERAYFFCEKFFPLHVHIYNTK